MRKIPLTQWFFASMLGIASGYYIFYGMIIEQRDKILSEADLKTSTTQPETDRKVGEES